MNEPGDTYLVMIASSQVRCSLTGLRNLPCLYKDRKNDVNNSGEDLSLEAVGD